MLLELIEIVLLFIIPVLLVYYRVIPFKHRKKILISISIATIIICILERLTLKQLGIRTDNILLYAIPYTIFTIVGILSLVVVTKIIKRRPQAKFYADKKFIITILLGSIVQEFLFRGFLSYKLSILFENQIILILINAILFTLIHIIYSNTKTTLMIIFVAGIFFAEIYLMYPNLILIAISHIILNHVALRYNFYREERTK
jgi:membrane protease YdiL (CAAX protease family)